MNRIRQIGNKVASFFSEFWTHEKRIRQYKIDQMRQCYELPIETVSDKMIARDFIGKGDTDLGEAISKATGIETRIVTLSVVTK